ncbi:MAG TPA: fused MFS/spermidine synthase [Cyanophyceae cyanobacterium]
MTGELNNQNDWQNTNLEAIQQRLQWLHEQPDGMIYSEPSGVHFIMVEKAKSLIRLALVGQVNLTSDLVQSELDFESPLNLVSRVSQAMMLGLAWNSNPKQIYMVGLGGGRIPLLLHHYFPSAQIECTEIDPTLIEVATKFFGVKLDDRLRVTVQDGRQYLTEQNPQTQYDLIFIDAMLGSGYSPYRLSTQEFYELCKTRLSPQGIVIVNLLEIDRFYADKVKTIQSVFEQVYLSPVKGGNRIIIAHKGSLQEKSEIVVQAKTLENQHQFLFPLVNWAREIKMGADLYNYVSNLEQAQILTDSSPPVGYFDNLPSFNTVFAKVDANHPCPCGSGQLFKNCHGY